MKKWLLAFGLMALAPQVRAQSLNSQESTVSDAGDPAYEDGPLVVDDAGDADDLPQGDEFGNEDMVFRKFVGIPAGYVYNPSLGTTHDYCSYSPDKYGKADFRGPCARHDMCYDSPTDKKKCDANLIKDMYSNCNVAYGALNPIRATCWAIANDYFAAVVIHH